MADEADMRKYVDAVTSLDFSTKGTHKGDLRALLRKQFADSPYTQDAWASSSKSRLRRSGCSDLERPAPLDDDELKWAAGGLSVKGEEETSEKQ